MVSYETGQLNFESIIPRARLFLKRAGPDMMASIIRLANGSAVILWEVIHEEEAARHPGRGC
jgi:hypothetical protein